MSAGPNTVADALPAALDRDLVERCLSASHSLLSEIVRSLPPRSSAPLRDLTLDQLEGLVQIPLAGQSEQEFIADRGLAEHEGRLVVVALLRRRLLKRSRSGLAAQLALTERGQHWRDVLAQVRRAAIGRVVKNLQPDQIAWILDLLETMAAGDGRPGIGAVATRVEDGSPDSLLERLLNLRNGIATLLGLAPGDDHGLADITLHQQEALLRIPALGLTMREFAAELGISHGSATALADRMVARGLVERQTGDADRRIVRLVPTSLALEVAARLRQRQRDSVSKLLARLDEQQVVVIGHISELLSTWP